jgi:hypothetical protein
MPPKLTTTPDGAPVFAPFKGFSILFEGYKNLADLDPSWKRLSAESETLYAELTSALDQLKTRMELDSNTFIALPPSSYHITLWDGLNQENVETISRPDPTENDQIKAEFRRLIAGLPDTAPMLLEREELASLPNWEARLRLVMNESDNLNFSFVGLSVWGDEVLVARLAASKRSTETLEYICRERSIFNEHIRTKLGINPRSEYTPHISLGYFTNNEAGRIGSQKIPEWNRLFSERVRSQYWTPRVKLYFFLDMCTFIREPLTEVEKNLELIRNWYLPSDEVRGAVRRIVESGMEDDKYHAVFLLTKPMLERDAGPDYDHAYQLEDGRVQSYYEELKNRSLFLREMLGFLGEPYRSRVLPLPEGSLAVAGMKLVKK